jgi:hypothetical protein
MTGKEFRRIREISVSVLRSSAALSAIRGPTGLRRATFGGLKVARGLFRRQPAV